MPAMSRALSVSDPGDLRRHRSVATSSARTWVRPVIAATLTHRPSCLAVVTSRRGYPPSLRDLAEPGTLSRARRMMRGTLHSNPGRIGAGWWLERDFEMEVSMASSRRRALKRAPRTTVRSRSRMHPATQPITVAVSLPARRLALDGVNVAILIGVRTGPQIGAALRWLEGQVGDNPELNTPEALTALLRFAPRSAWDARPLSASDASNAVANGPARSRNHADFPEFSHIDESQPGTRYNSS